MKLTAAPQLSIGLPVYNGENFLHEALISILAQDFVEFELVICDNASTDRTEAICRDFCRRDRRVRYFRNPENIGASGNCNRVFELSKGEFFKWIAHDDLHEHDFLSRTLEILTSEPDVVVAFTRAVSIDSRGRRIREWATHPDICSVDLKTRYARWLAAAEDPLPLPIFGVMRANVLRKTRGFMAYPEADIALLTELSLYGRFAEVPEPLFLQREHRARAGPKLARNPYEAVKFWDPQKGRHLYFPHWSLLAGYLFALAKAPLSMRQRRGCLRLVAKWANRKRGVLFKDVTMAASRMPVIGAPLRRLQERCLLRAWYRKVDRAARDLETLIPRSTTYLLVDDATFGSRVVSGRHARPFLEGPDGYAGPPLDDETAVRELERMRQEGAAYLAIAWPCFWWLTYYRGFIDYLNHSFPRILENDRLIVFELRTNASRST